MTMMKLLRTTRKRRSTRSLLPTFFIMATLAYGPSNAQSSVDTTYQARIDRAVRYMDRSQQDSATAILDQLMAEFRQAGTYQSELALTARLYLAEITYNTTIDSSAQEFLTLIELGTQQEAWKAVARARISLALVYEVIKQKEKCEYQLTQAAKLIQRHQLTGLISMYAVRRSSYFRILERKRDSAVHYARMALKHAGDEPSKEKADAYFLTGTLLHGDGNLEIVNYFRKAADVYAAIGNQSHRIAMMSNISKRYRQRGQLEKSMNYSDSSLLLLRKIDSAHLHFHSHSHIVYKDRSDLFRQLGQLDSAIYYIERNYKARLDYAKRTNARELTAIEAQYEDKKKSEQIEQQAQQIEQEKAQRNRAVLLSIIALLFVAVLAYLYTQLRRVNRQNKQQAERLANLDKAKSRFFVNVSHELRTPLTLILGPVQTLLKEDQLTARQQKLLHTIHNSGKKLYELVDEILQLRKLEMDKLTVEPRATSLHSFFNLYIAQFESLADRKAIQFDFNIEAPEQTIIELDQEKCRQIVANLLSNALKFTPEGGQIEISILLKEQRLHLSVSDTGEGIHPDDLPHIFDRYFQTNRPEKPVEGGTGIGLALCQEYVDLFGGSIHVESQLGSGTTFLLDFPVTVLEDSPLLPFPAYANTDIVLAPDRASTDDGSRSSILIVEDTIELSDYLKLILSDHYRVVTAENGLKAWEYITDNPDCDLVLSDLMMPVMDGYQLLNKMKSSDSTRHIPVIMLTARAEAQDRLKALRIGVDDYLIKPFDEEELLVRIDNLLRRQEVRRSVQPVEQPKPVSAEALLVFSKEDNEWLMELEAFAELHISSDLLNVPMLANRFAMSESTLLRQLKRLTGLTPAQYLKTMRLTKARQMLENRTYNTVAKVAYEVGYTDPKSFSRAFKQQFGKLPSELSSH